MLGRHIMYLPFGQEIATYTDGLGQERYDVGQKMMLPDGRSFRYGRVGATTLVRGTLQQAAVPIPNHINQTIVTATAIGATSHPFTLAGTAMDYDMYAGGVFAFTAAAGTAFGQYFPIPRGFANAAASAVVTVPFQTGYSMKTASNTSDVASLEQNPWRNVVQNATAQTSITVGVANVAAATAGTINATGGNAYGVLLGTQTWLQVAGPCMCLTDNTTVVNGQPITASTVTAGCISLPTTTNFITSPIVGQMLVKAASAGYSLINIAIVDY